MHTEVREELKQEGYIPLNGGLVVEKCSMKQLNIPGGKVPTMRPNLESETLHIMYCFRDKGGERFIPCNTLSDMQKIHEKHAGINQEIRPWFSGHAVRTSAIPSRDIRTGRKGVGEL